MRFTIAFLACVLCAASVGCIQSERRSGNTSGGDTTTTGDTSATTADAVDPDASGCTGCVIDDGCVASGTSNPVNVCQVCDPEREPSGWAAVTGEVACEDDDECTSSGTCFEGGCVAPLLPDCGVLPSCASEIDCDDGTCQYVLVEDACLIDGDCYEDGAIHATNACLECDADEPFVWSFADSRDCDDDDECTYEDRCSGGVCVGTENDCSDQYECTLDFCDGGSCVNQVEGDMCLVEDACRELGEANPDEACRVCDPQLNQLTWSVPVGEPCGDDDVCTIEDTCGEGGACRGERKVLGQEPNEEPAQAQLVGQGVTTFPAGTLLVNLNPLTDKDFFSWSMPLVALDGVRRPKARVENGSTYTLRACVYAACGPTTGTLVAPILACDGVNPEVLGPLKGCCTEVAPNTTGTIAVEATCVDGGTVQQGFGYASVRLDANVASGDGPQCGDYTFKWGAELK